MKIILIAGDSKTGKSTTVSKNVRDWLLGNGAEEKEVTLHGRIEYEGVFQYKDKKIALQSRGDAYYLLVFAIVKYTHLDVLVLIGNTSVVAIAKLVEQINANKDHHVFVKKAATNNDNSDVCDKITNEIKKI